jgi:hypothetical protein
MNRVVIICLHVSRWLDDNESKQDGSQSQPRNWYGDYSTRDEDEDQYDIAMPDKPYFESYPIPSSLIACLLIPN